ncbi:MAG: MoaD/ThiS family protein [Paenibacillus sp.]|jgi:molybdopterin converting factor small subunit|nr:MoaD/ThiS family protein [Paenibacillus sp.]
MDIEVTVPSLLMDCTGGQTRFMVTAGTLQEALDRLFAAYPLLQHHIYNESGVVRKHVLLYYNDQNLEWLDDLNIPLQKDDRLLVLQAVSGG